MPASIIGCKPRDRRFQKDDRGGGSGSRDRRGQQPGGEGGGRRYTKRSTNNNNGKLLSIKDLRDSMLFSDGGDGSDGCCVKTKPSEKVTYLQASTALALYRGQALGINVLIIKPPCKGLEEVCSGSNLRRSI
jgi:hypothetical protein